MIFRLFAAALVLGGATSFAAGTFQRLYSNDAEASSFLQNDWNKYTENYHPKYALDDDPKTAWVEGAPGNGEGESLTLRFSPLSSARTVRVRIRNGYQRSKQLLEANSAPKDVTLSLLNTAGEEVFKTRASLTRAWGWQQVDLSPPPRTPVAFLKLRIDSTWSGSRYKDTCISDVQLLVDSDVPYNAKAELAKKAALARWIKDRKDTAKYFAALPKTYPFASTHYEVRTAFEHSDPGYDEDTGEKSKDFVPLDRLVERGAYPTAWKKLFDKAQMERIQRLLHLAEEKGGSMGKAWYRPAFTGHLRLPDGLPDQLAPVASFLQRANYALFEATTTSTHSEWHPPPAVEGGGWQADDSQLRVEFADASTVAAGQAPTENAPLHVKQQPRIHALYFWQHEITEERETYEETRHALVVYDAQERPSEVLLLSIGDSGWSLTALSFALDARGRVEKVIMRQAAFRTTPFDEHTDSNEFQMLIYSPATQG